MSKQQFVKDLTAAISKDLIDEGKIIEAGWVAMRTVVISKDATAVQIREMRMAFFAGAQHLFASIMSILDPGEEPTDSDLRRMDNINKELAAFAKDWNCGRILHRAMAEAIG